MAVPCLEDVNERLIAVEALGRPARQAVGYIIRDLITRSSAAADVTHGSRAPSNARFHFTNALHSLVDLKQRL